MEPAERNSQRPEDEENLELEEESSEDAAFAQIDLRLEDFTVRYFEQAERLQIDMNGADAVQVINRCLEHLAGQSVSGPLDDSPKGYFLDGMYEDLVGFADSFSEAAEPGKGVDGFQPMSKETWTVCLQRLRETVERLIREEGL